MKPVNPLLGIAERLYRAVLDRRNAAFDAGKGVTTFDRPVVSVGNLSMGGTGKSPMVRWVVRRLMEHGRSPCIAMRGYGARKGEKGDEQLEHESAMPGVAVVARPDRTSALIEFFSTIAGKAIDTIVLDDGFQHRKIARDFDIVLIDAEHDLFADRCVPAGRLRERPAALTRADAVVITHAERVGRSELNLLVSRVRSGAPRALVLAASHAWAGASVHRTGHDPASCSIEDAMLGKRLVVLSAIGRPEAFEHGVTHAAGEHGTVVRAFRFRDHHPLDQASLSPVLAACDDADALVCTAKDWAKLAERDLGEMPVVVPELELVFEPESGEIRGERALIEALLGAMGSPANSPLE